MSTNKSNKTQESIEVDKIDDETKSDHDNTIAEISINDVQSINEETTEVASALSRTSIKKKGLEKHDDTISSRK